MSFQTFFHLVPFGATDVSAQFPMRLDNFGKSRLIGAALLLGIGTRGRLTGVAGRQFRSQKRHFYFQT